MEGKITSVEIYWSKGIWMELYTPCVSLDITLHDIKPVDGNFCYLILIKLMSQAQIICAWSSNNWFSVNLFDSTY